MKENKTFIIVSVIVIILLLLVSIGSKPKQKEVNEKLLDINYETKSNESSLNYETENPVVAMYIKNYGSIVMELYPDVAPNTVNNFISLVKSGFYDDNSFHRLVPGFVLQGGDPEGFGSGGPGYTIKGEFSSNGIENTLKHEKGVISMARGMENDSAGSQFFICLTDVASLDTQYATFGRVIDGWDIIEKIEKEEKVADEQSGKLATNLTIKKALVDLKGKEYAEPEKVGK